MSAILTRAKLNRANLEGATLYEAKLQRSKLVSANLKNADLLTGALKLWNANSEKLKQDEKVNIIHNFIRPKYETRKKIKAYDEFKKGCCCIIL